MRSFYASKKYLIVNRFYSSPQKGYRCQLLEKMLKTKTKEFNKEDLEVFRKEFKKIPFYRMDDEIFRTLDNYFLVMKCLMSASDEKYFLLE